MGTIDATYGGFHLDAGGFSFTLSRGVTPSTCRVTFAAGTVLADIPETGDLVISDGTNILTLPMWVDKDIQQVRDDRGDLISATLKDRRWKWKYGIWVLNFTRFNQPDSQGRPADINPANYYGLAIDAKTLVEDYIMPVLGEGETGATFDTTNIPDDKYPAVMFEGETPAQVLQGLMEELGLVVCLGTDNVARVYVQGEGEDFPVADYDEETTTTATPELPSKITIMGARIVREKEFNPTSWVPIGEETEANDSVIKVMEELSYAPGAGLPADWTERLGSYYSEQNIVEEEIRKLQEKCIMKWYRCTDEDAPEEGFPWLNSRAITRDVVGAEDRAPIQLKCT